MSIIVSSPFYHHQGHYKNYSDFLLKLNGESFNLKIARASKTKDQDTENKFINLSVKFINLSDPSYLSKFIFKANFFSKIIKFFFHIIYLIKLNNIIKQQNIKYIYFLDYEHLSLIIFLLFYRKFKYFICVHSVSQNYGIIYKIYKYYFFSFLKYKNSNLKGIITNSNDMKIKLIKLLNNVCEIHDIQFPVEVDSKYLDVKNKVSFKENLKIPINKKVILIFGLLRTEKNYLLSFEILKKLENNYHLLIVGSDHTISAKYLYKLSNKFNLKNCTIINDYVKESEIGHYFQIADIYLFNYLNSFKSQSGPVSLCRQFKLPVVAYSESYVGKYILENGFGIVTKKYDSISFMETINDYFNNDNLRQDIQNNFINTEKYSFNESLKKYLKIFSD